MTYRTPNMTPADIKATRAAFGLSQATFARIVGVQSGRTVRRWESGESPVPGPVVHLLTVLTALDDVDRVGFVQTLRLKHEFGKLPS